MIIKALAAVGSALYLIKEVNAEGDTVGHFNTSVCRCANNLKLCTSTKVSGSPWKVRQRSK